MKIQVLWLKKQGFTLIEILIVIAIVGILAGFAINQYNYTIGKNSFRNAKNEMILITADMEARHNLERKYIDLYPNGKLSEDEKYHFTITLLNNDRSYRVIGTNVKNPIITTCLTFGIDEFGTRYPTSPTNCWEN